MDFPFKIMRTLADDHGWPDQATETIHSIIETCPERFFLAVIELDRQLQREDLFKEQGYNAVDNALEDWTEEFMNIKDEKIQVQKFLADAEN